MCLWEGDTGKGATLALRLTCVWIIALVLDAFPFAIASALPRHFTAAVRTVVTRDGAYFC